MFPNFSRGTCGGTPRHSNWSHVTLCFEHPPYRKPASGFFSHQSIGFSLQKNTVHKKCNRLKLSTQIMGSPVSLASLKFILWHSWWIFVRHLYNKTGQVVSPSQRSFTRLHWATQLHCSLVTRHHCLSWSIDGLKIPTINQPAILQLGDLSQKPMKNSSQFSNPKKTNA